MYYDNTASISILYYIIYTHALQMISLSVLYLVLPTYGTLDRHASPVSIRKYFYMPSQKKINAK